MRGSSGVRTSARALVAGACMAAVAPATAPAAFAQAAGANDAAKRGEYLARLVAATTATRRSRWDRRGRSRT